MILIWGQLKVTKEERYTGQPTVTGISIERSACHLMLLLVPLRVINVVLHNSFHPMK